MPRRIRRPRSPGTAVAGATAAAGGRAGPVVIASRGLGTSEQLALYQRGGEDDQEQDDPDGGGIVEVHLPHHRVVDVKNDRHQCIARVPCRSAADVRLVKELERPDDRDRGDEEMSW